jgi:hypothetical protein
VVRAAKPPHARCDPFDGSFPGLLLPIDLLSFAASDYGSRPRSTGFGYPRRGPQPAADVRNSDVAAAQEQHDVIRGTEPRAQPPCRCQATGCGRLGDDLRPLGQIDERIDGFAIGNDDDLAGQSLGMFQGEGRDTRGAECASDRGDGWKILSRSRSSGVVKVSGLP